MDRLYKTPVEVPKRRSHSLELGVIKRQDQQPSKPVEAFPKGRPPPPPEKQFSQWSVKNQDVKPLRADHNEYHLNSLRPQIILSDTPSRTQTPRKKFPPASVPLERRGAPPDQSIQTDEPFISGRTFPPYWGSFWYPPPPSHPPGPWYMNHQPPWEQPGSQPQTSTSLWTPVLPFTFPIPNNVGTTNSSPEKEERSFIGILCFMAFNLCLNTYCISIKQIAGEGGFSQLNSYRYTSPYRLFIKYEHITLAI